MLFFILETDPKLKQPKAKSALSSCRWHRPLCSLCEVTLLSRAVPQIELLRQQRPRQRHALKQVQGNIERPITAILSLNILAHPIGPSVAGAAAAPLFGQHGLIWLSLIFILVVLFFIKILSQKLSASIIGREIVDAVDKVRNIRELTRVHKEILQNSKTWTLLDILATEDWRFGQKHGSLSLSSFFLSYSF